MRADIQPGAHFPDYELTDHTRVRRKLSESARQRSADSAPLTWSLLSQRSPATP